MSIIQGNRQQKDMFLSRSPVNQDNGFNESDYEWDVEPLRISFDLKSPSSVLDPPTNVWDSDSDNMTRKLPDYTKVNNASSRSSIRSRSRLPLSSFSPPSPSMSCDSDDDNFMLVDSKCVQLRDFNIPFSPRSPSTPPHKKLRSLRLYDTPHTPKSLLNLQKTYIQSSGRRPFLGRHKEPIDSNSPKCYQNGLNVNKPHANINPFTPSSLNGSCGKRTRTDSLESADASIGESTDDESSSKKVALHDIATSRYKEEYHEVFKLGTGEFGCVYKCLHRLDGLTYAIKKSKMPVSGSVYERMALREVQAHAVLGRHPHVVQYYSAWAESNHMYIQNEFCNGGSLADAISQYREHETNFQEEELRSMLVQIADGLRWFHSSQLVHLDIKPGNIFIHTHQGEDSLPCIDEDEDSSPIIYKIGDLGHVTVIKEPVVEEGDCRYLPKEILQEDFSDLPKADVFSLALTIFESASLDDLPKNGDPWHSIRDGHLPFLSQYSDELNSLLKEMIHPDPTQRPTAASLSQQFGHRSRSQLIRELDEKSMALHEERVKLNEEKLKNEILQKQLQKAKEEHKLSNSNQLSRPRQSRLIGGRLNRSMSLT